MIFGKKAFYYVGFTLTNLLTKVLFESWESQAMKKLPVEVIVDTSGIKTVLGVWAGMECHLLF